MFEDFKFRCSSLGALMSYPDAKDLPDGVKTKLREIFIEARYGRKKDISNRFLDKGLLVEEDSMTLLTKKEGRLIIKNKKHYANDQIKGTPDIVITGECVKDIKSSWDIWTYFSSVEDDKIKTAYYWQGMGYLELTGEKLFELTYCLVNTPEHLIADEERKMHWKMNLIDDTDPEYIAACEQIRKNMTYDDIPERHRIKKFTFEYNKADIMKLYHRLDECRKYLNLLSLKYM